MQWHTVAEAARAMGLSRDTVYVLVERRRIGHRRIGIEPGRGKIRISDGHIDAYLASCEVPVERPGDPATQGGAGQPRRPSPTYSGRPDGKPLKYDWSRYEGGTR